MRLENTLNKILIVDFGSQFTQLIARKIRELGIYCEIVSHKKIEKFKSFENNIKGIVLSGGPLNVYESKKVKFNNKILKLGIPVLGICFGHQIIADALGGKVEKSRKGWGVGVHKYERKVNPEWSETIGDFFSGYVSHQDQVIVKPENAYTIYGSDFCPNSILCYNDIKKPVAVSIQSHPEFKKECLEMIIQRRIGQTIPKNIGNEGLESLKEKIDNPKVFKPLLRALRVI